MSGVAKSAIDNQGVSTTHVHTQHVVGTLVYISPEYKNGQLSVKVDSFAFGLDILEALTVSASSKVTNKKPFVRGKSNLVKFKSHNSNSIPKKFIRNNTYDHIT